MTFVCRAMISPAVYWYACKWQITMTSLSMIMSTVVRRNETSSARIAWLDVCSTAPCDVTAAGVGGNFNAAEQRRRSSSSCSSSSSRRIMTSVDAVRRRHAFSLNDAGCDDWVCRAALTDRSVGWLVGCCGSVIEASCRRQSSGRH